MYSLQYTPLKNKKRNYREFDDVKEKNVNQKNKQTRRIDQQPHKKKHVPIQTTIAKNNASVQLETKPYNNTVQESQEPTWHEKVKQETNALKDITNIQTETMNTQTDLGTEQPLPGTSQIDLDNGKVDDLATK
ncbi:hypothetical protein F8M41_020113 [Gigaspora margarita]|uniref:Uncharacterized protein n=1 Tax=Gigaspora margarita TaxID=4874 RepID=A0A8H4EK53_GIGMA|nr:hypothetical protein F8M41_020113 [Gigaspora margarita]